ncbi:MAG: glycosyltransferase family 9 protein [Bacteroidia bacterium]
MPKKILVVRFSSIGDIVLISPILRCLKKQTGAEVHVLTKSSFRQLLYPNPHVDKVITIEKQVREVASLLKQERYDFVVDLHHNLRSMQVKRLLQIPSASFPKLNIKKWLLVFGHINLMPDVHIVDRYFDAVKTLGVTNDGEGLDYFIPADAEVDLQTLPVSHQSGYIAFTVGAKFATKQMPVSKITAIINQLELPVVLLGGPEDMTRAAAISSICGDRVFDATGKYSLHQSASLVRQAVRVIAHDTGLMHIAAAFKKQIHSVWGNTVPLLGMYPYLPGAGSKIVEVKNLSCRPCSKIGHAACPKGHFKCMNLIDETAFGVREK